MTTVPTVPSPVPSVPSPGTRNFLGTRIAVVAIAILTLIGISIALAPSGLFDSRPSIPVQQYSLCPGSKDVVVTAKVTIVEVRSHCLTGKILLPVGHDSVVDAPGELEYFFWNGQRFKVEDKTAEWLGQAPYSTFRLRGKSGQAIISITKQ